LYFLIDEFQDTNGSQNEIVELLLAYWDKPNVFCVGDDDQSIYRFQGANIENIANFIDKYKPSTITLKDNYRSSQAILDSAGALISLNKTRINPDKKLLSKNENLQPIKDRPEIWCYYNLSHELVGIANQIMSLQKAGVKLNEMAVIYRKHAQADELIRYLQAKNIPINARKKANALEEPFIQKIIQILRYIGAEQKRAHSGEAYLYELLHYSFFDIAPLEIASVSVAVYQSNFGEKKTTWREELRKMRSEEIISSLSKLLENWIKDASNITLPQLVENIISQSGMLLEALVGADKMWNMQLIHSFFDFLKEECSRNKKTTIHSFLEMITLMEDESVTLSVQKIKFADDGVHLLTAHSSKGLEFEYVIMMGSITKYWEKGGQNPSFKLPDTLFTVSSDDDSEESRRLFYVAMTRAKNNLTISFARTDNDAREHEESIFVREIEGSFKEEILMKDFEAKNIDNSFISISYHLIFCSGYFSSCR
jgi:DNA helicase-2/ATP-dependent DNA helicase PcrA